MGKECKIFILLIILAVSFAGYSLSAQEITEVKFLQEGSYQYADDLFRYNVQTKKGQQFSDRAVNDDVRRLYSLGIFSDVVSEVGTLPDGKKSVTFRVHAKPVVSRIEIQGNKKYEKEKLLEKIRITAGVPLNEKRLHESLDALQKFYQEEGLNDATVNFEYITEKDGKIAVIIKITENLRLRVNEVTFEGAKIYTESELRDAIETRHSYLSQDWLSWLPLSGGFGLLNREAIERDKVRLREVYWRKGYLDFTVKDVKYEETPEHPELINVKFIVSEGQPYFVGKITISGNQKFKEEELRSMILLQEDNVYSSLQEDQSIKGIEAQYRPLGYCDFRIYTVRKPDYETRSVDIEFKMIEGIPYTVDKVFISGNKWTKDHVIRRELVIDQDDPVDKELLEISKNRLLGMGYFEGKAKSDDSGVEVVAVNSQTQGKKNIHVNVHEKRFIDGKIGAGWSDSDSLTGMIELSHNNMDILDPMHYFTGGGQRLRIIGMAGLKNMNLEGDFTEPWLFGIPLRLDISGYWRDVAYENWNERRIGFTIGLTKRIFDDFTTIAGGYTFEQVRIHNMDSDMSKVFQDEKGNELVGRIHLSLSRDTRNNLMNPTSGYEVGVYAAITSQAFGATKDYYKVELHGINYFPFFHDWFVLSTGFKIGSTGTFDSSKEVPMFDRYFLGGGDSVRGFPYRSIGPEDSRGDVYGGNFMYLFTAELSHPIYNDILRGGFFVDIGDVTSGQFGPITTPNIGIGYGLRIKLPQVAVPIRLDLAYPILSSQDGVDRKLRFHFNMGFSL